MHVDLSRNMEHLYSTLDLMKAMTSMIVFDNNLVRDLMPVLLLFYKWRNQDLQKQYYTVVETTGLEASFELIPVCSNLISFLKVRKSFDCFW